MIKLKKILKIFVVLVLILPFFEQKVGADSNEIYFYEETIEILQDYSTRATSTRTAKKTATVKNENGEKLWYITVTGTFTYNGKTSTCTKSVVDAGVYNSRWSISKKTSSKTANKAIGTAYAKLSYTGGSTETVSKTVTLTCSANGTCS